MRHRRSRNTTRRRAACRCWWLKGKSIETRLHNHMKGNIMSTSKLCAIAAVLLLCFGTGANVDDFDQYGSDITLGEAKTVAAGALKECEANKWYMAVAVVDTHGALVYFEKMDNTELASAKIALDKAGSAAGFKRPIRALGEVLVTKAPYMVTVPGVDGAPGGLPIYKGGKIIGAVAASGGTGDQDEQCAKTGLAGF